MILNLEALLKTTAGMYVFWIFLHYTSVHLYAHYCNNLSVYGFLLSPLTNATPICKSLNYIIYNGGNNINSMWIIIGSWFSGFLVLPRN
jgi:hypothetical protein|tara:strand:- start:465 stop:731 length:267 start_codon:yes stop_codon:yes gene_type:complete